MAILSEMIPSDPLHGGRLRRRVNDEQQDTRPTRVLSTLQSCAPISHPPACGKADWRHPRRNSQADMKAGIAACIWPNINPLPAQAAIPTCVSSSSGGHTWPPFISVWHCALHLLYMRIASGIDDVQYTGPTEPLQATVSPSHTRRSQPRMVVSSYSSPVNPYRTWYQPQARRPSSTSSCAIRGSACTAAVAWDNHWKVSSLVDLWKTSDSRRSGSSRSTADGKLCCLLMSAFQNKQWDPQRKTCVTYQKEPVHLSSCGSSMYVW